MGTFHAWITPRALASHEDNNNRKRPPIIIDTTKKQDITNKRAREHLLKEVVDLLYVCHQMGACFGWDLQTAYNRVHGSNMSKLGEDGKPIRREDGKILKGPNYFEPNLIDLV